MYPLRNIKILKAYYNLPKNLKPMHFSNSPIKFNFGKILLIHVLKIWGVQEIDRIWQNPHLEFRKTF